MKRYRCANCGAEADHPEDAQHMVECPDPAMFSTQQPGVAVEDDAGPEGQRFCVFYPDGRMCGEPAVDTLVLPGGKGGLDICASHLGDLVNHHRLRTFGPTQQQLEQSTTGKEDCA